MNSSIAPAGGRREEILAAAFRAWGETYFANTSLSKVARELDLTKAALYRHFSGKADLIESMEEAYLQDYVEAVLRPLEQEAPEDLEAFVSSYFHLIFDFFVQRPEYYVFLIVHVLRDPVLEKPRFQQVLNRSQTLLGERLGTLAPHPVEDQRNYLTLYAIYWLTEVYRTQEEGADGCATFRGLAVPPSEDERRRIVEAAVRVCTDGFVRMAPLSERQLEGVERIAWINREEMLEPDRIFSAIEEVVADEGFTGATVEKIAERIGMTKSSLYFYFRNKDEMFGEVVEREKAHFASLAVQRLRFLETTQEKVYALFLMFASYAINNPTQVTVLNWLRYRNVQVRPPRKAPDQIHRAFEFLKRARKSGEIESPEGSILSLGIFPNFLVSRKVLEGALPTLPWEEQILVLRRLYRLFEQGLVPREEKSESAGRIV